MAMIDQAFRENDEVVICIGSAQRVEPLTIDERHRILEDKLERLYPERRWRLIDLVDMPDWEGWWHQYVMGKCGITDATENSFYRSDPLSEADQKALTELGFSIVEVPRYDFDYRSPDGGHHQISSGREINAIHEQLGMPIRSMLRSPIPMAPGITPFLLGITGPSGSGKTTLALALEDAYPGQVTVVHMDDYFKEEPDVPRLEGLINWDHPGAFRPADAVRDLESLKAGVEVVINTKSPRLNPDFDRTLQRIPYTHWPAPLIVFEGLLVLHFPGLRELMDRSIYLDARIEQTAQRRVTAVLPNWPEDYDERVLFPMFEKYVAPTRAMADRVLNVSRVSAPGVRSMAMSELRPYTSLNRKPAQVASLGR
jgi:uridine kinase